MSHNYAFMRESIPRTLVRRGHRWRLAQLGLGAISASRLKSDGRAECRAYTGKHMRIPCHDRRHYKIFKAISVPTRMKRNDPHLEYRKGEIFYITYIREVKILAPKVARLLEARALAGGR